ncbi:MAG: regulator of protease activity HflC (stomatin/prohibitin superfamily) [Cryomorphaceae bacterium]|jgi:regulator of protease activity HflC (stomatin/prohibitin superfamily)
MNSEILIAVATASVGSVAYRMIKGLKNEFLIKAYEEGLLYKKGVFLQVLPAGEHTFRGEGYELIKIDKRVTQMVIQPQEIFTQDHISVKVSGVVQYKIIDPRKFHEASQQPLMVAYGLVQVVLRDAVAELSFEEVNSNRKGVSKMAMANLGERSLEVGIAVDEISVRDLIFPSEIKSAFHDAVCAQKVSIAKLETARGEVAAARAMANVSKQYAQNPEMMQLKYLEVLQSAADSMGNTFVLTGADKIQKSIEIK